MRKYPALIRIPPTANPFPHRDTIINEARIQRRNGVAMVRTLAVLFCGLMLMCVVGCSQYDDDYQFTPRPVTAQIPGTQPSSPPPVTVEATVVGVRYNDDQNHIPPSVEIRMRMDNDSDENVTFDPMSLQLTTAQLVQFPPPIVRPPTPITIGLSQSAYLTIYFPFPAGSSQGNMDLSSLQLKWQLQIGQRPVGQVVNFNRVATYSYYGGPYYYGYYAPPPPVFYGGVVVVHRRRW
jgi:hypothetical protein